MYVPFARTFTSIVIESYQAVYPTDRMRLGVYDCDQNMHPTVPVFDSGNISPIGIGRIMASGSFALQAKPYYLALLTDTFGINFRGYAADQYLMTLGWRKYADNSAWMYDSPGMTYSGGGYAPFPDLTLKTTPSLKLMDAGGIPLIGIR